MADETPSEKKQPISYYYETFELDTYFTQNKIKIPQVKKVDFNQVLREFIPLIKLLGWIFVSQIVGIHRTRIFNVYCLLRSREYRE